MIETLEFKWINREKLTHMHLIQLVWMIHINNQSTLFTLKCVVPKQAWSFDNMIFLILLFYFIFLRANESWFIACESPLLQRGKGSGAVQHDIFANPNPFDISYFKWCLQFYRNEVRAARQVIKIKANTWMSIQSYARRLPFSCEIIVHSPVFEFICWHGKVTQLSVWSWRVALLNIESCTLHRHSHWYL